MELECLTLTQLASLICMPSMFTQPPAAAGQGQTVSQAGARPVRAGWLAGWSGARLAADEAAHADHCRPGSICKTCGSRRGSQQAAAPPFFGSLRAPPASKRPQAACISSTLTHDVAEAEVGHLLVQAVVRPEVALREVAAVADLHLVVHLVALHAGRQAGGQVGRAASS